MKRPIIAAIFALALSTTAAVAQQPAGQQPAAKPATQQPAAKPATTTAPVKTQTAAATTKTTTRKHRKHSAKTSSSAKMDSTSAKPKN